MSWSTKRRQLCRQIAYLHCLPPLASLLQQILNSCSILASPLFQLLRAGFLTLLLCAWFLTLLLCAGFLTLLQVIGWLVLIDRVGFIVSARRMDPLHSAPVSGSTLSARCAVCERLTSEELSVSLGLSTGVVRAGRLRCRFAPTFSCGCAHCARALLCSCLEE